MTVYLSASQHGTAEDCLRKWAFKYLAGYEEPPTIATTFGNRVHFHLENYLKDGTPPPLEDRLVWTDDAGVTRTYWPGACAQTMIGEHLPKPGAAIVEGKFTWYDEKNEIHWRGYKDAVVRMPGGTNWLTDHKTSTDPVKWGHTPETLRKDRQYLIYGGCEVVQHGAERLTATWNYGARDAKPNKARIVQIAESAQTVLARYEKKVVPLARKLVFYHSSGSRDPMDYEPSPSACGAYGGCPHRERCNLTTEQHLGALFMARKPLLSEALDEDEELELEEEEEEETPPPRKASNRRRAALLDDDEEEEEEEEEEPAPVRRPKRTVKVEPEEESEEPPKKRGRPKGSKNKTKPASEQPAPRAEDRVNPPESKKTSPATASIDVETLADAIAERVFEKLADALSKAAAS